MTISTLEHTSSPDPVALDALALIQRMYKHAQVCKCCRNALKENGIGSQPTPTVQKSQTIPFPKQLENENR